MRPVAVFARAARISIASTTFLALSGLGVLTPMHRAAAAPPATAAVGPTLSAARWIEHRVSPGERISEIAELYGVEPERLLSWNKLNQDRPMIRTGHALRILTSAAEQSRLRDTYVVRRGDSWSTIAKHFEVTRERLREQWNPKRDASQALQAGDRLIVFRRVEPQAAPAMTVSAEPEIAPLVPVTLGAQSTGRPDKGRILNGTQIPINEALYTLRNPDQSWGCSHAVSALTLGIQRFRATSGFEDELVIMDMSRRAGGRFRPHESHQSGRDVDIRLPLRSGIANGTVPLASSQVDWDATWALVRALISTEQVRFIFLARNRQIPLYQAAKRAGASDEELAPLLQYPRRVRTALVRHARGHVKHIHVRFLCGPNEASCVEP